FRNVFLLLVVGAACFAAPAMAQTPETTTFLAKHYDVSATLDAAKQTLFAVAKVDFEAQAVSSTVRVELHPNLGIKQVQSADGKLLSFERDPQNPLIVSVTLPAPMATGGQTTLTFTYAGLLANEENSPVPGVRAAAINKDGGFLLLP